MALEPAELVSALRQAKKRPMFFVYIAKGINGTLHLDKKKIPIKVAREAKIACGGGIIFKGTCRYEADTLVFEIPKKPPATLAGQIKKVIKRDAAMIFHVEVRSSRALAEDEEEEEATAQEDVEESIPDAPPLGPPPLATRFTARLEALAPVVQAAEKFGGGLIVRAKQRIAEGNKQYDTQAYALANAALDRAEALLKQAFAENHSPSRGEAPADGDRLAKKFAARLKALAPVMERVKDIKNSYAREARLAISEATALFRMRKYADALSSLDTLEKLLKKAFAANNAASQSDSDG